MSEIEERQSTTPLEFQLFVHGGGTMFRAHSPQLDITAYGESVEAAKVSFFILVRGEVKGILEGKGQVSPEIPDERIEHARLISQTPEEDINSLFEINPEGTSPGPQYPGLK